MFEIGAKKKKKEKIREESMNNNHVEFITKELMKIEYEIEKLTLKKNACLNSLKQEWKNDSKEYIVDMIYVFNKYPNTLLLENLTKEEILDNLNVFI